MNVRWSPLATVLTIGVGTILASCVTTTVHVSETDGSEDVGFRYRESLPYVLVTSEVEQNRTTDGKLYTLEPDLGFVPLCDDDKDNWATARLDCAKKLIDLRRSYQQLISAAKQPAQDQAPAKRDVGVWPEPSSATHTTVAAVLSDRHASPIALASNTAAAPGSAQPAKKEPGAKKQTPAPSAQQKPTNPFADTPAPTDPKSDTPKSTDAPAPSASGPMQIVWLPNFCKYYSVRQSNFLSTSSLKISLANGWQLQSVDSSADSTAVVGKVLDTVGAILGAGKGSSSAAKGAQSTAQGAPLALYAKTTVTFIKSGLYPLVTCDKLGYSGDKKLTPHFSTEQRVLWLPISGSN